MMQIDTSSVNSSTSQAYPNARGRMPENQQFSNENYLNGQVIEEFRFPLKKEQLCDQPADQYRFWVKAKKSFKNVNEDEMLAELESIYDNLHGQQKCQLIVDNDNFDYFYSMIYNLEDISACVRAMLINNLNGGLRSLLSFIEKSKVLTVESAYEHRKSLQSNTMSQITSNQGNKGIDINLIRNSLKAYVYLITFFLSENSKLKDSKEAQSKVRRKNQGQGNSNLTSAGKVGRQNSNAGKNEINYQGELRDKMISSLKFFRDMLGEMDLQYLWKEQKVEEDFVKAFVKMGFDLLENPNNTKFQEVKELLFSVLQICMERFGQDLKYMQSQNTTKIIDLLYNQDNLAPHMADFVGLVAQKQGPQMPNEIIKELTQQIFGQDNSAHESIGIKNIAIFLRKLSKICPKILYQNISNLLNFFECESYLLRQALIKILGNIIIKVLHTKPELESITPMQDPNQKIEEMEDVDDDLKKTSAETDVNTRIAYQKTKDKFLELLLKRFNDKSSFCRSKAMKVFMKLIESNVVADRLQEILQASIARLKDQTTQVRKTALRLLHHIIVMYGYKFNLNRSQGQTFCTRGEIEEEKKNCSQDIEQIKINFKQIFEKIQVFKDRVQQQTGLEGQELIDHLQKTNEYQSFTRDFNQCKEASMENEQILQNLDEYQVFLNSINEAIDSSLIMLLSSKTQMDTIETIKLFAQLHQFGIENAEKGIRKMLTLLFSKEAQISQVVFEAYRSLYFDVKTSSMQKTANLLHQVRGATLTDLTCLEELIVRCIQNNALELEVVKLLFKIYEDPRHAYKDDPAQNPQVLAKMRQQEQRSALKLIRMIGSAKIDIVLDYKNNLYSNSLKFAKSPLPDFVLIQEALLIYEKVIIHQMCNRRRDANDRISQVSIQDSDKKYLQQIFKVIINNFGTQDLEWFCATEAILNTLFNIKTKNAPEYAKVFIQELTKKMYTQKGSNQTSNTQLNEEGDLMSGEGLTQQNLQKISDQLRPDLNDFHYSHIFFVAGHIAIKMLTYIEQIDNELKKAGTEQFGGNQNQNKNNVRDNNGEENKKEEDELDQIAGGKEAEIEQYSQTLKKIIEESLIQEGLLGRFLVPIVAVAQLALEDSREQQNGDKPGNSRGQAVRIHLLQRSAIMALCKYMCVSEVICQENLDLVILILKEPKIDFGVKANIIISLGDMFNRFPNTLNEKTKDIFGMLHDCNNNVRKQALMVITHLILNDMLKLKGEIVDICMLLEDPDKRIQDQVKLFLHELHTKGGNNIYNLFPKAISRLSKEFHLLTMEEFQNIAKHLMTHIDKDKQTEQIVEKLCNKFRSSDNPIEWRNTAYCLSQLKYNEKIFIKLLEFYDSCYKDILLQSEEVKFFFSTLAQTLRKQFLNKPDLRKFLDEFDQKIGALNEQAQAQIKQNQLVSGVGSISKAGQRGRQTKRGRGGAQIAATAVGHQPLQDNQVLGDDVEIMEIESNQEEQKRPNGNSGGNPRKRKFNEISSSSGVTSQRESIKSGTSAPQIGQLRQNNGRGGAVGNRGGRGANQRASATGGRKPGNRRGAEEYSDDEESDDMIMNSDSD